MPPAVILSPSLRRGGHIRLRLAHGYGEREIAFEGYDHNGVMGKRLAPVGDNVMAFYPFANIVEMEIL